MHANGFEPDIKKRCTILHKHPLFSSWPNDLLKKFVQQMFVAKFKANQIIVVENEAIDSLYFIVEGRAYVSRVDEFNPQSDRVLATLNTGESIGFSETGIFSQTGTRTATVTAITPTILIGIKLVDLEQFLRLHPVIKQDELQRAAKRLLTIQLVKQAIPFSELSHEQLLWLVDHLEELAVSENTIVLHEGDVGDFCYLIAEGTIEITKLHDNNEVQSLAMLTAPSVFGETALILNTMRSATATTRSVCRLLRLNRQDLLSVLAQEHVAAKAFSSMMMERARPKRDSCVVEYLRTTADQENIFILKHEQLHQYFELNHEGLFVWHLIDGRNTIKDMIMAFDREFHIFSPSLVIGLISNLVRYGFVELEGFRLDGQRQLSRWVKVAERIRSVMEAEYIFSHVDAWVTKWYQRVVHFLYTKFALLLMFAIIIYGTFTFITFSETATSLIESGTHLIFLLVVVDIASLFAISIHELAHAFTTKYFGRVVHHFGIGWYWLGPIAFTETSDMWLCTRWPRVTVDLAGIFIDLVIAGVATIIASYTSIHNVTIFLWLFALFRYLSVYYNLFTLIEMDGYYALMDWLDRPHLRSDAIVWLTDCLPKIFRESVFTREYGPEILYWFISFSFVALSPFIAWFIQHHLLIYFFPALKHGYWRYFFATTAIFMSFFTVWSEIRKQQQLMNEM